MLTSNISDCVELACLKFQSALSPKRSTLLKQKSSHPVTSDTDVKDIPKKKPCRTSSLKFTTTTQ